MKTLLLIILLVLSLVSCTQRQIFWQQLEDRNDIYYVLGETKPYSGKSTEFHPNGQLMWEGTFKNGELDGLERNWYENGQLKWEATFENDEQNGLYRSWYETGELKSENPFKNGKPNGLHRIWNEKGELMLEVNYVHGKVNESVPSLFVGVWIGQSQIGDGKILSWKQVRKPDGSYRIELKTHLDGDLIESSEEEGQWWVKNEYFYEQNNTIMKMPDVYLYKILNERAIKFIRVSVDETAITYTDEYEFIDYKQ